MPEHLEPRAADESAADAPAGSDLARGLDTNVLVRYFVADDPKQHAEAVALIEGELTPEAPGLVHPVALCELVWVLRRAYKVPKAEIVSLLRLTLSVRSLRILDEPRVREALALYESHGADFADCLLHAAYQTEGTGLTTFDQVAALLPGAAHVSGPSTSPP
jgi:predicted nucleic-acid-binding protein